MPESQEHRLLVQMGKDWIAKHGVPYEKIVETPTIKIESWLSRYSNYLRIKNNIDLSSEQHLILKRILSAFGDYRPDVYAEYENKIYVVECVITSEDQTFYDIASKCYDFFKVLRSSDLPYTHSSIDSSTAAGEIQNLSIDEMKEKLIQAYNNYIYNAFKDQKDFRFIKYEESTKDKFGLDKHKSINKIQDKWFNIPDEKTQNYNEWSQKIHLGISIDQHGFFYLFFGCSDKPSVQQFLQLDRDELLIVFKKLGNTFHCQNGFAYVGKKHPKMPLPYSWNDIDDVEKSTDEKIYFPDTNKRLCGKIDREALENIFRDLEYYLHLGSIFQRYPRIDIAIARTKNPADLTNIMYQMTEGYRLFIETRTNTDVLLDKIRAIPDFEKYLYPERYLIIKSLSGLSIDVNAISKLCKENFQSEIKARKDNIKEYLLDHKDGNMDIYGCMDYYKSTIEKLHRYTKVEDKFGVDLSMFKHLLREMKKEQST